MKSIVVSSVLSIVKFSLILAFWIIVGVVFTKVQLEELGGVTPLEYIQKIAAGIVTNPIDAFNGLDKEAAQALIGSWNLVFTILIIVYAFGIFLNIISMILIKVTKSGVLTVILGLIKLISGSFISAIVYFVQSGKLKN